MIDSRSSSIDRSMPLRADSAWRRKLSTETPAISCGYWKARNMPALPRTSGPQSVMSSPWKRMRARGDLVLGAAEQRRWPASTCPSRSGPSRAWTSPAPIGEVDAVQDREAGDGPDVEIVDLEERGGRRRGIGHHASLENGRPYSHYRRRGNPAGTA